MRIQHHGSFTYCPYCHERFPTDTQHRCAQPDVSTADAARSYLVGKLDRIETPDDADTLARAIATLIEHAKHTEDAD